MSSCLFQGIVLVICITVFTGSVLALGAIVSAKPLEDLGYKGWTGEPNSFASPYASSVYLGWLMASAIALVVTGVLPIVSWFSTYRFSLSSAICVGIFAGTVYMFALLLIYCYKLALLFTWIITIMCVYILVSPVSVAVLVAFCGASYLEVVKSREDQVPTKGDFLAALLPLVCIPALLSLCSGWLKWLVNFFFL